MKTLIAFSLMVSLFSCSVFGTRSSGSNDKPQGAVVSYEYSYQNTMMYPITWYEVSRDGEGRVCIAWSRDNEAEIRVIRGPEDLPGRIGAIVEEYRLYKLKNHYTPRADIRDGYMWRTYIRFEENSISAGGSNAWPKEALWAGVKAINDTVQSLIDASSEDDIIARRSHDDR